ncbi:MAG: T9SS type A sorting domain-containing protein, partial [Saprospirales bacterium]|nr:T9SS type A sorting domain-containing protein [Saprospirales bacterium]
MEPYFFLNGSVDANEYTWFIEGSIESEESEFEYTFESAGTYLIGLVAASGVCSDTAYYSLVVQSDSICNPPSFVFENRSGYRIFPNPARDILYIRGLPSGTTVEIYDLTGILRLREEESDGVIEVSGLA